jgi:hypothetical protein
MKKTILFASLIWMLGAVDASASCFRVNNQGMGAPYTTINGAIGAASSGDTIYVEGSSVNYSSFTCSKQLIILGPGYFLSSNPETQACLYPATISGSSTFGSGSSGSVIMGISFSTGSYYINLTINAPDVVIKRNSFYLSSTNSDNQPILQINANNTIVAQNFFERIGNGYAIRIAANMSGILIHNNYLSHASLANPVISSPATSSLTVTNNVFSGYVGLSNANVFNNIMINGSISYSLSVVSNNIGNSTQFPLPDNLQNIDMNLVFDLSDPSPDGKFRLIDSVSNPAIGYGNLGEDCGMFGGNDPYKLSGVPPVPAIYFFYAPVSGSDMNGLPAHIKIKSNE